FHAEVLLHLRSRTCTEDWHGGFYRCDFVEEAAVVRDFYLEECFGHARLRIDTWLDRDYVAFLAEFFRGGIQCRQHSIGTETLRSVEVWVGAQAGQTLTDGAVWGATASRCFAAATAGVALAVGLFHAQCTAEGEHDQVSHDCYWQSKNQGCVFHSDHTARHEHGDGQHSGNNCPENTQPLRAVLTRIRDRGGEVGHDHRAGVSGSQVEQQTGQGGETHQ